MEVRAWVLYSTHMRLFKLKNVQIYKCESSNLEIMSKTYTCDYIFLRLIQHVFVRE